MRHRHVKVAVRANVLTKDFTEKPAAKAPVAPRGEERIIGLLEPVLRVGVATEMRIAQVELRRPRQGREFVPRLDIPRGSLDPSIDRVVSLQDELAVEPDIRVEFEERTREIAGVNVQALAVAKEAE